MLTVNGMPRRVVILFLLEPRHVRLGSVCQHTSLVQTTQKSPPVDKDNRMDALADELSLNWDCDDGTNRR